MGITVNYVFRLTTCPSKIPGYGLHDRNRASISGRDNLPVFSSNPHNASVIQPIVLGPLSLEIYRKKREGDRSLPSREEVNYVCSWLTCEEVHKFSENCRIQLQILGFRKLQYATNCILHNIVFWKFIFILLYIIPSTQHKSLSYSYMFRLNKSSSGVCKNHN